MSFLISVWALFTYSSYPIATAAPPVFVESFSQHPPAVYIHIFSSVLALAIGPLQFSKSFRGRFTRLHRWLGRIYLGAGIAIGGLSGLFLAQYASQGVFAQLGFSALSVLWLYTGFRAFRAIKLGSVSEHREWMYRNFALTFAAVTLRVYTTLSIGTGLDFSVAYPIIAWLCWVPNYLLAEWFIYAKTGSRRPESHNLPPISSSADY
ncbi:DUF2306 domain-containing protein [Pseudomaricurvus alkylphenolicus]|nr:DUF2306 domain-containing protein [Pseudomaricurvus alkylphenolicus]